MERLDHIYYLWIMNIWQKTG